MTSKVFSFGACVRYALFSASLFLPIFKVTYEFGESEEFGLFAALVYFLPGSAAYMFESLHGAAGTIGLLAGSLVAIAAVLISPLLARLRVRHDSRVDTGQIALGSISVLASLFIASEVLLLGRSIEPTGLFGLIFGLLVLTFAFDGLPQWQLSRDNQ